MMINNTQLTIISTKIRQDDEGRYCLNDCHKASGLGAEKRPSKWLITEQAKDLITELEVGPNSGSPLNTVKTGNNLGRGTYACKELVYAYAMWINPKFHLAVIRAFDAMIQGKLLQQPRSGADTTLPLRRARLAFSSALRFNQQMGMDIVQARLKALVVAKEKTGIDLVKEFGWVPQPSPIQAETLTATELGKRLGIKAHDVNLLLQESGFQTGERDGKGRLVWTPTPKGRGFARLEDKAKLHSSGTVQQWRWYPAVLTALEHKGEAA